MTVIVGDCVNVMARMPEASVDAICTDPPYGLSFMGKDWDSLGRQREYRERDGYGDKGVLPGYGRGGTSQDRERFHRRQNLAMQEWHERWAREALRVLKPGGYLLAFGGTRTYHRLACAVEDAGFEIRDRILVNGVAEPHPTELAWGYASGFPKSLDVSKAIDKQRDDNPDAVRVGAWLRAQRERARLKQKEVAAHWPSKAGGLTGCVANWELGFNVPKWDQWLDLKGIIGFGDEMDAEVWRLNGRKGQPGEAWHEREKVGEAVGYKAHYGGSEPDSRTFDVTAPATDDARRWQGWGTALKPAHEPIVVARKPLSARNVAANVLEHGTGALNIDACRIAAADDLGDVSRFDGLKAKSADGWRRPHHTSPVVDERQHAAMDRAATLGRWPANVVLVHAEDCIRSGTRRLRLNGSGRASENSGGFGGGLFEGAAAHPGHAPSHADDDGMEEVEAWECVEGCRVAALDAQSGTLTSGDNSVRTKAGSFLEHGGLGKPGDVQTTYGDSGGASRFFYCAKASRAEREAGLLGKVSCARCGGLDTVDHPAPTEADPFKRVKCVRNDHPTVKPVGLMRWLLRLATPPGGLALDPFAGSGTTLCAGAAEGIAVVGIEEDERSAAIADARAAHWAAEADRERAAAAARGMQLTLGGEAA